VREHDLVTDDIRAHVEPEPGVYTCLVTHLRIITVLRVGDMRLFRLDDLTRDARWNVTSSTNLPNRAKTSH
jgi:hypothetical protein